MPSPKVPKYQAIYADLRGQILRGQLVAGSRLPPQKKLATQFGVSQMTLRQALDSLADDGLVTAVQGRGTFVADRPVDITMLGNLSSFIHEMRTAGVELVTDLVDSKTVAATAHRAVAEALQVEGDLLCLVRRRSSGGTPFALQRSYLSADLGIDAGSIGDSLYGAIEQSTGWNITEATESITAVGLGVADASLLDARAGHPALLSIRTSFNQFESPYLYDEALLVGGRCTITANRTTDRLSLRYRVDKGQSAD